MWSSRKEPQAAKKFGQQEQQRDDNRGEARATKELQKRRRHNKKRTVARGTDDDPCGHAIEPPKRIGSAATETEQVLPSTRSVCEEEEPLPPVRTMENRAFATTASFPKETLPHAMPVTRTEEGRHRQDLHASDGPVAIATRSRTCDWSSRRGRVFVALGIFTILGIVAAAVTSVVIVKQNNDAKKGEGLTASPVPTTTSFPLGPATEPPTNSPTNLVLEQLGETLRGATFNELLDGHRGQVFFGWSVKLSSDGQRLAASAPFCPCVYIFDYLNGSWINSAQMSVSSGVVDHISLSGDGNVLVAGVPRNEEADPEGVGGEVQAFKYIEGSWQKLGSPVYGMSVTDRIGGVVDDDFWHYDIKDEVLSTDSFDSGSIALSENGSILAVGSYHGNYVRVLQYDEKTDQWERLGNSDFIMGEDAGDDFGSSVDLSGDGMRLVVGAPDNLGKESIGPFINHGHVRVFEYSGERNEWDKLGQDIDGNVEGGGNGWGSALRMGASVSISVDGSTIQVGAVSKATSEDTIGFGVSKGYVKVFKYIRGRDEWNQQGNTINAFQAGLDDSFASEIVEYQGKYPIASTLSGDGKHLAIGVPFESLDEDVAGVVRLFELRGHIWTVVGDPVEGTQRFSFSGRSISLSYNGSRLAIGSPQHNEKRSDDGQVRVFEVQGRVQDPILPTAAPSTSNSTATPTSTQNFLPTITVLLLLNSYDDEKIGWTLHCHGILYAHVPVGTYPYSGRSANVTEAYLVPEGAVCQLKQLGPDFAFQVFYGEDVTNDDLLIVEKNELAYQFDFLREATFIVSPSTVSVTIVLQLDAFPEETYWSLQCGNVSYVSAPLGSYDYVPWKPSTNYMNQLISTTLMGIENEELCTFVLRDSYGDGLCCDEGIGFYKIYFGAPVNLEDGILLAAGGSFGSQETVHFVASPIEGPMTSRPSTPTPTTSSTQTHTPTLTPAPSNSLVSISIVIQLDGYPPKTGWSLRCNDDLVSEVPTDTYDYGNESEAIVETLLVEDGATCLFIIVGGLNSVPPGFYEVYYGDFDTDTSTPLVAGTAFGEREEVWFTVSHVPTQAPTITYFPTTSTVVTISIVLQLDMFALEMGWSLKCDGLFVAEVPIGTYRSRNELLTETRRVEDGSVCQFIINDSRGDGFCCSYGFNVFARESELGYYKIFYGEDTTDDGILLVAGRRFDYLQIVEFKVSRLEDPITSSPTVSPPTQT